MSRRGYPLNESIGEFASGIWYNSSGGIYYQYSMSPQYTFLRGDAEGPNSPDWPRVRTENPYSIWRTSNRHTPVSFRGHNDSGATGSGTYPMCLLCGISDPAGYIAFNTRYYDLIATARDRVTAKLQQKIKDQKVNVAQFAAEFHQVCGTVASTATRLANAFRSVKRGNLRSALNELSGGHSRGSRGRRHSVPPSSGSVSRDWLSIQYGWKPLLSDVYGACEELARLSTFNPPALRVSTGCNMEEISNRSIPNGGAWAPNLSQKLTLRTQVRGVIEYNLTAEFAASVARTGITNPVTLAWELLPYSFVVDWFIPVGNYLSSFDYDLGLQFLKGWYTVKVQAFLTTRSVNTHVDVGGDHVDFNADGLCDIHNTAFTREIMSGFPHVKPPSFKDPFSPTHVANALALLRVAFGR